MVRHQQLVVLLIICTALVYDNHGYSTHGYSSRRRVKTEKSGVNSEPDTNNNSDINICSLERRTTVNLFCNCDEPDPHMASSADCWVFNNGESKDSPIWREFKSQSKITKLSFNVRGSTTQTLTFIPTEALVKLPGLRTLEIVYANISSIHSHAFANLSHLQDLALGRNKIVRLLRQSIAYMEDLRVVTLGDNNIDNIANDVFAKLPALRKLYMDKNNISYIAEGAFEQLRKLEELDLSENQLKSPLSRYVFLGLDMLRRLDMRANHIDRIAPEAFAELVSLEELVLDDNVIKTIDGRGFSGLINLQRLSLAENRLTALDDRTFRRLEKLKFIDLRYNNLQTLTFGTVEPILDRLQNVSFYFYIKGNVFDCHCNLLWINRLAEETANDQVRRELTSALCLMNDTTDGVGGGGYGTAVAGQPMIYATVVGGYDQLQTSKGTKSVAIAVDEIESAEGDGGDKPFDESKMIKVSSLNEDTCPGKEQPLVEGAPDAAQNSDRVLLPVKSGGAIFRPTASMQMLSVLLPLSVPVLLALCSRH